MTRLSRALFFMSILPFTYVSTTAQELSDLEKVRLDESTFTFDYRLHRNPVYILKKMMMEDSLEGKTITYLYNGDPIYSTTQLPQPRTQNSQNSQPGTQSLKSGALNSKLGTPNYKLDLQLKPFYYAEYGDFRQPLRLQLAIGPRLQWNIWNGFYGVFQWMLPVYNDFDVRLGFGPRPGELGLGYIRVLGRKNFLQGFVGTFTNDRYGFYGEYTRMLADGKVYLGGSLYYTGAFRYDDQILYREIVDYWTGNVHASYRFVQHDLTVRVVGEKFLRNDEGVSLEVFRQFGNTDIGFYGTRSRNGDNAGFFVVFALWPRKFYSNKWLQVRFPHSFRLLYDLRPNTGISERTRPYTDLFYDVYRYNPFFINNQLDR